MDAAPLLLSTGWAAGVNAYMTVLLLGVFGRLGLGDVPDGLESPAVMAAAAALYAVAVVGTSAAALASHGVKAGLRLAVNVSPDPVTTATASLTEDFLVGVVVALALTHPWLALTVAGTLLAIGIVLLAILWRQLRAGLARRKARQAESAGWSARSS